MNNNPLHIVNPSGLFLTISIIINGLQI